MRVFLLSSYLYFFIVFTLFIFIFLTSFFSLIASIIHHNLFFLWICLTTFSSFSYFLISLSFHYLSLNPTESVIHHNLFGSLFLSSHFSLSLSLISYPLQMLISWGLHFLWSLRKLRTTGTLPGIKFFFLFFLLTLWWTNMFIR